MVMSHFNSILPQETWQRISRTLQETQLMFSSTRLIKAVPFPLWLLLALVCDLVFCGSALAQGAQTLEATGAYSSPEFADGAIRDVVCDIMGLVGGTFGGMLLTAAGIVAMTYAAFGDAKYASSLIVVGVGAFAMSAMISIYFGDLGCTTGEGQQNRQIIQTERSLSPAVAAFGLQTREPAELPHGDDTSSDPFDF